MGLLGQPLRMNHYYNQRAEALCPCGYYDVIVSLHMHTVVFLHEYSIFAVTHEMAPKCQLQMITKIQFPLHGEHFLTSKEILYPESWSRICDLWL